MREKIQRQEKARRNRERIKMGGLPTPPGTKLRMPDVSGQPVFKEMPNPSRWSSPMDFAMLLTSILGLRRLERWKKSKQEMKEGKIDKNV